MPDTPCSLCGFDVSEDWKARATTAEQSLAAAQQRLREIADYAGSAAALMNTRHALDRIATLAKETTNG